MAITIEQWKKKQAQAPNGWKYSVDCYSKDELKRTIDTAENEKIQCTIYFTEEFDRNTFKYTGFNLIKINISLWRQSGEMWQSSGLGKTYTASEKFTRKAYKYLIEQAVKVSDDLILSLARENKAQLLNANIF